MRRRAWTAMGLVMVAGGIWSAACSEGDASSPGATPSPGPAEAGSTDGSVAETWTPDATTTDVVSPKDATNEDAPPPVLKRVSGHVELDGPVVGAQVTVLSPSAKTTTTDANGDFFFYLPLGASAVVKVEKSPLFPMIRGVVVGETNRIRVFYMAGPAEKAAVEGLGLSLDPSKGVIEVDFRNATVGGYGAKLTGAGASVAPGFGLAFDADGNPVQSTKTVSGGNGSTLLLGNVPAGSLTFAPETPLDAGLPCKPCDANPLPVQPGVVTWFDFECGNATDCQ